MPDGEAKVNATLGLIDYVAKKVPPGLSEMIDAYRYQNMLSGWQTQGRNIGENLMNAAVTRPADIAASGFYDWSTSWVTGKQREVYVKDVALYYRHAINSLPDALEAFKATWRGLIALEKPDLGTGATRTQLEVAIQKQLPKSLTVVQRFMEASDRFMSTIISRGEYAVQLKRGVQADVALSRARKLAERYLYRETLDLKKMATSGELSIPSLALAAIGQMMTKLRTSKGAGKLATILVPFLRTPINKGIVMIEHSPLALARYNLGKMPLETKAKIMTGTIATAIGAIAALEGRTTWLPPKDQREKELFYATKQPLSVLIPTPSGEKWVPMWYFGAFALAFALPTAVDYYWRRSPDAYVAGDVEKIASVFGGVGRFIGSQSSTQSIGAFFNVISGQVDYTFWNQMGFTAEQFYPASGLIRTVNKMVDNVYRKADGFHDSIIKDVPFFGRSTELPAHKTPTGEPATRERFPVLFPYEFKQADDTWEEILYLAEREAQLNSITNRMNKEINRMIETNTWDDKKIEGYLDKINKWSEDY